MEFGDGEKKGTCVWRRVSISLQNKRKYWSVKQDHEDGPRLPTKPSGMLVGQLEKLGLLSGPAEGDHRLKNNSDF